MKILVASNLKEEEKELDRQIPKISCRMPEALPLSQAQTGSLRPGLVGYGQPQTGAGPAATLNYAAQTVYRQTIITTNCR